MNPSQEQYISHIQQLIKTDLQTASTVCRQALTYYKNQPKLHHLQGEIYRRLGQLKESLEAYSAALEINSQDAETWYHRGRIKYLLKDFKGAIEDLTHALLVRNEVGKTLYLHRGASKQALEDYAGAMQDYQLAVSINPDCGEIFFKIGQVKYQQKDYVEAINCFSRAIELIPQAYAPAWFSRAQAKLQTGDLTGALADFQQAMALDPTNQQTLDAILLLKQKLQPVSEQARLPVVPEDKPATVVSEPVKQENILPKQTSGWFARIKKLFGWQKKIDI